MINVQDEGTTERWRWGPTGRPGALRPQTHNLEVDYRTYVRYEYTVLPGARLLLSLSPPMDGHQALHDHTLGSRTIARSRKDLWCEVPLCHVFAEVFLEFRVVAFGR